MLDKQLEKAPLAGKGGTLILGASPCIEGWRRLLVQLERPDLPQRQVDMYDAIGCDIKKDGKGWIATGTDEGKPEVTRFQLSSLVVDAANTVVLVAFEQRENHDGPASILLLARAESFEEVSLGRGSNSHYELFLTPQGKVTRVATNFLPDGYEAHNISFDADGEPNETERPVFVARVSKGTDEKAAEAAKEELATRCPKLAPRLLALEMRSDEPTEYWLGVPSYVRKDATAAVRQLKACGASATVETITPAPEP
ncbi:MAG: hypothetical protein H0T76_22005 [Nannocystis sp.]|nr:hypothetical protein [Nannocystis sp.]MBA3549155.1 hypothetical protein [Nannocystis sp.]